MPCHAMHAFLPMDREREGGRGRSWRGSDHGPKQRTEEGHGDGGSERRSEGRTDAWGNGAAQARRTHPEFASRPIAPPQIPIPRCTTACAATVQVSMTTISLSPAPGTIPLQTPPHRLTGILRRHSSTHAHHARARTPQTPTISVFSMSAGQQRLRPTGRWERGAHVQLQRSARPVAPYKRTAGCATQRRCSTHSSALRLQTAAAPHSAYLLLPAHSATATAPEQLGFRADAILLPSQASMWHIDACGASHWSAVRLQAPRHPPNNCCPG